MRKSILLPLLVLACAGDAAEPEYRIIPDFNARSELLACRSVDLGNVSVERLNGATDTTFLVLDAARRRVIEYSDRLEPVRVVEYQQHGPAAIREAVDAAILGDTAVAVLARGGLKLVVLAPDGRLIRAQELEFIPNSLVAMDDGGLLITPMPMGPAPGSLLFRYRPGGLEALDVPQRDYADMMVGALGNTALVERTADGSALVVHQFLSPRAFRVVPTTGAATPLPVPTPDATRDNIAFLPRAPVTADQFGSMLVPGLDISVDRTRDHVYLLTRSGRDRNDRMERAVLRLDHRLEYLTSYLLDVHAVQVAALPRRNALLVADDTDRLHLCTLHAETQAE